MDSGTDGNIAGRAWRVNNPSRWVVTEACLEHKNFLWLTINQISDGCLKLIYKPKQSFALLIFIIKKSLTCAGRGPVFFAARSGNVWMIDLAQAIFSAVVG